MTFEVSVDHLLSNNCAPSPDEVAIIKHLSSELDNKLVHLDLEISRVYAMLDHLDCVRRTIIQKKAAHASILSISRHVPVEIWGEILYFALPSTASKEGRIALQTYASVCCGWRRAAYCTPKLWTTLEVSVHASLPLQEFELDIVNWFKRSGTLLISFTLNTLRIGAEEALQIAKAIPGQDRWWNFSFNASDQRSFLPMFTSSSECRWGMLEELQLSASSIIEAAPSLQNDPIDLFRAPHLRKLGLSFNERLHIGVLRVPWAQLTYLSLISETTSHEHLTILQECINLEECELGLRADEVTVPFPAGTEVVKMPNLWRLGIWTTNNLAPFLSHLQTPALQDLLIDVKTPYAGTGFEATIMEFVHRSECRVRKLNLREPPLHDGALFSFLIRFDFLVELRLKHVGMNGSLFKHLRRSVCIPDLQVVEVEVGEDFSRTSFIRFLQSRYWCDKPSRPTVRSASRSRISRIRRASLAYDEEQVDLPSKAAEELRNEGLVVDFQQF